MTPGEIALATGVGIGGAYLARPIGKRVGKYVGKQLDKHTQKAGAVGLMHQQRLYQAHQGHLKCIKVFNPWTKSKSRLRAELQTSRWYRQIISRRSTVHVRT